MTREESTVLCLDAATELDNRHTPLSDSLALVLRVFVRAAQPVAWEETILGIAKAVVIA